jgi:sigma-54 specific flagellar transcriptional regulator A
VKLLRLLQERSYEPIGSSDSVNANFRLIAATNRDLSREVRAGRFRSDLFYRLNVCPVRLPALRERPGDVVVLFNHFWSRRGERRAIAPDAMATLQRYAWPGNVRELENVAERLSVCVEGDVIALADLDGTLVPEAEIDLPPPATAVPRHERPPEPAAGVEAAPSPPAEAQAPAAPAQPAAVDEPPAEVLHPVKLPVDMPRLFRELEDAYIKAALAASNGSRKEAAALLGMGRTTLVEKLRRRAGVDPSES